VDIIEIENKETLGREEVATRLRAIADALASDDDIEFEQDGMKVKLHLPEANDREADDRAPARVHACVGRGVRALLWRGPVTVGETLEEPVIPVLDKRRFQTLSNHVLRGRELRLLLWLCCRIAERNGVARRRRRCDVGLAQPAVAPHLEHLADHRVRCELRGMNQDAFLELVPVAQMFGQLSHDIRALAAFPVAP
jgi:amphi-Trp domain-containing protein